MKFVTFLNLSNIEIMNVYESLKGLECQKESIKPTPNVEVNGWRYLPQVVVTLGALDIIGADSFRDTTEFLQHEGMRSLVACTKGTEVRAKEHLLKLGLSCGTIVQTESGGLPLPYYQLPIVIAVESDRELISYACNVRGFAEIVGDASQVSNDSLLPEGVIKLPPSDKLTGIDLYNPIARRLNTLKPSRKDPCKFKIIG